MRTRLFLFVVLLLWTGTQPTQAQATSWHVRTLVGTGETEFRGDGAAPDVNITVTSIAVHPKTGEIFFSGNNRIRKLTADRKEVVTVAGNGYRKPNEDDGPALAAHIAPTELTFRPNGELYFVDGDPGKEQNSRIRKLSVDGLAISTVAGRPKVYFPHWHMVSHDGAALETEIKPSSITLDGMGRTVYFIDSRSRIRRVNEADRYVYTLTGRPYGSAAKDDDNGRWLDTQPRDESIAITAKLKLATLQRSAFDGQIYIGEEQQTALKRLTLDRQYIEHIGGTLADQMEPMRISEGTVNSIALDSGGRLYFAVGHERIFRLSADGTHLEKVAGRDDTQLHLMIPEDGPALEVPILPKDLILSKDGKKLYFSEIHNRISVLDLEKMTIRRIVEDKSRSFQGWDTGPMTHLTPAGSSELIFADGDSVIRAAEERS